MPQLTTLDELEQHVTLLASGEESDVPFISFILTSKTNLTAGAKHVPSAPVSWRIGRINALFTHVQQLLTAVDSLGNHAIHPESG
jgi:hypothetical protein